MKIKTIKKLVGLGLLLALMWFASTLSRTIVIEQDLKPESSLKEGIVYKITCFTSMECRTQICQSGRIEKGEVALNPKHGYDKIIYIPVFEKSYNAKWISDYHTDIDIYFGNTKDDYKRCLEFGVQYAQAQIYSDN